MLEYKVLFTARASADLLAARRWLTQPGSGLRAQLRIARINRAVTELRFTPDRWPVGPVEGYRQRIVEGYTLLYGINHEQRRVQLLRVFGPYQDRSNA